MYEICEKLGRKRTKKLTIKKMAVENAGTPNKKGMHKEYKSGNS